METENHFQLPSRGFWYFALFLLLTVIQELVVFIAVTGNPGIFFLFGLLTAVIFLFMLYYGSMLLPLPVVFPVVYLLHKAYLFAFLAYHTYYMVPMDLLLIWGIAGAGINVFLTGLVPTCPAMLILLPDLPVFILLWLKYKQIRKILLLPGRWLYLLFLPLAAFLVYQGGFIFAGNLKPGLLSQNQRIAVHGNLGFTIVNRMITESADTFADWGSGSGQSPAAGMDDVWANLGDELPAEFVNGPGFSERRWFGSADAAYPNFICLQVESMQCGLEYVKHNGQYVMPYLHSLTETAVYYPYCFAYHVVGGTSDCEFSVLNNVEPKHRERLIVKTYQHPNSLIKVVKNYGYQPLAFHNYFKDFYDRGSAFERIGFEYLYDFYDMGITKPIWGNEDREMFEFILANTGQWRQPFLYYVINLSSHPGFSHIHRYHEAPFLADIKSTRDKDAFNCFNYVDIQLEKFIKAIRQLYPDTWIFIYGDHSLAEVEFAGQLVRSGITVDDDYLEFVPLFLLSPDNRQEYHADTLASFHDIGTTIVSLLPEAADSRGYLSYSGFGGSLVYDKVAQMPIPFRGTMYDRAGLLEKISAFMEPYRVAAEALNPEATGDAAAGQD